MKFVPNSKVVLYNGGKERDFGIKSGINICPYSRPIENKYKLGRVLIDAMLWVEEENFQYDYLVYLDSDVLFINKGYEKMLNEEMAGYDGMLIFMKEATKEEPLLEWSVANAMWQEWEKWQPFFKINYFMGCLNTMQVYRKSLIKRIITSLDYSFLDQLLEETEVPALEEIIVPTLAARCGGLLRPYPKECAEYTLLGDPLRNETIRLAKQTPYIFFVHPIKRSMTDKARLWIRDYA